MGDYQLGQRLGSGGMGTVYLARQISMNRLVALKILHTELVQKESSLKRFFREMRINANVTSDGFARVYEAGQENGVVFFSMEYVEGQDLNTQLRKTRQPFSEEETLEIALFVAETMGSAWAQNKIVHRDIKPANIIRTVDGEYKLLDLGVSKSFFDHDDAHSLNLTQAHFMVGSPAYMSPEQANETHLDCRADIYSLGITMYHLLTGKLPYDSPSQFEVIAMHFQSPVPDVKEKRPDVSNGTKRLICKMLAKEADDRQASWEELAQQIRKVIARRQFFKRFASVFSGRKFQYYFASAVLVIACILLYLQFISSQNKTLPEQNELGEDRVKQAPVSVAAEQDLDRLREETLEYLLQLSAKYEKENELNKALALWVHFIPPPALKNDEVLRQRIREQIRYLQKQISGNNQQGESVTTE
ncbi:MAG: serine/threonine protein kinase [Lentisphaeria bacterium]|nr:serine/threonine protein kinase [Lentisphaeria bacterium]